LQAVSAVLSESGSASSKVVGVIGGASGNAGAQGQKELSKEHSKTESESDLHRLEHEASTTQLHQVAVDLRGENNQDQAGDNAELVPQIGLGNMMRFDPVLSSSTADISVSGKYHKLMLVGLSAKLSKGVCLAKAN
jgi:hypothetical protein